MDLLIKALGYLLGGLVMGTLIWWAASNILGGY